MKIAILGSQGAGKSTLAGLMGRWLARDGEVKILARDFETCPAEVQGVSRQVCENKREVERCLDAMGPDEVAIVDGFYSESILAPGLDSRFHLVIFVSSATEGSIDRPRTILNMPGEACSPWGVVGMRVKNVEDVRFFIERVGDFVLTSLADSELIPRILAGEAELESLDAGNVDAVAFLCRRARRAASLAASCQQTAAS